MNRNLSTSGAGLTRRQMLHGVAGAAGAVGIAGMVGACQPEDSGPGGPLGSPSADSGTAALPTYSPAEGATAELAATDPAGLSGYSTYPTPVATVTSAPGSGDPITSSLHLQGPPPVAVGNNPWWQALDDLVGSPMEIDAVPAAEYGGKLATLMAGGKLPHLVQMRADWVPRMPEALGARFIDLSEHLSGDAVLDYPNLAGFPTIAWQNLALGGGLYGVPCPLRVVDDFVARADLLDQHGVNAEPASADDFLEMAQAVTDTANNRWAACQPNAAYFKQMAGVPNDWQIDGGRFVKDFETEQWQDYLELMRRFWDAGIFHPDGFGAAANVSELWKSDRIAMRIGAGTSMVNTYHSSVSNNPDYRLAFLVPPKSSGGGDAATYLGNGMFTFVAIPQTSGDRVPELLGALNALGAPFGSTEYLTVNYGVEGTSYSLDDGVLASIPGANLKGPFNYLPGAPMTFFAPGHPEVIQQAIDYESRVLPEALARPTIGLYSRTQDSDGPALTAQINDAISGIISKRMDISEWDLALKDWQDGGGDTIRAEYEQSLAERG